MNNDRYLFRGKRIDNGKWVQGYYVPVYLSILNHEFQPDYYKDKNFIAIERTGEEYGSYAVSIDESTIGQCTGIKDKNGKLIFEWDLIKYDRWDAKFTVIYEEDCCRFICRSDKKITTGFYMQYVDSTHKKQIIGNIFDGDLQNDFIHDNPELLEAANE